MQNKPNKFELVDLKAKCKTGTAYAKPALVNSDPISLIRTAVPHLLAENLHGIPGGNPDPAIADQAVRIVLNRGHRPASETCPLEPSRAPRSPSRQYSQLPSARVRALPIPPDAKKSPRPRIKARAPAGGETGPRRPRGASRSPPEPVRRGGRRSRFTFFKSAGRF